MYSDTSWLAFCHISDIFWESCNNLFTYMNLVFVTDKFIFVFIVYCEHLLRIFINSLRCCKLLMDVDFLYSTTHTLLSLFIIYIFIDLLRSSFNSFSILLFSGAGVGIFQHQKYWPTHWGFIHCLTLLLNKILPSPWHSWVRALIWFWVRTQCVGAPACSCSWLPLPMRTRTLKIL